ncbi:MAG: LacI family DNA-binding transcriptional regulator [Pseudomonadota bacterium]
MVSRKPTSLDIAYRAGVSQATVSRALRDSPLVNIDTRKRIREIAEELNYQVDRSASSLRSGNTRTLALLIFEDAPDAACPINPFFLNMLGSITRACSARDYDLLVSMQKPGEDWYARYEEAHRADGLILLGYGDYIDSHPTLERLCENGAHWVLWGPRLEFARASYVGCDNQLGGYRATRHLLDQGRRQFCFIGNNAAEVAPEFADRYAGFRRALEEAGIGEAARTQEPAESSEASGRIAVRNLVNRGFEADALVCASDLIALGALKELEERSINVPREVSVMGFDDIEAATFCNPPLSTMRQDVTLAGATLIELLLQQIEAGNFVSRVMEPELIVRSSCGA